MTGRTATVMVPESSPSFLDSSVDLKKLLKEVSKETKKAIEVLAKLLESTDEKTRMTAATRLLDLQVSLAEKISTDQMQRLIAEKRLGAGAQGKLIPLAQGGGGTEEKPRPLVDFGTIQEVN